MQLFQNGRRVPFGTPLSGTVEFRQAAPGQPAPPLPGQAPAAGPARLALPPMPGQDAPAAPGGRSTPPLPTSSRNLPAG